MVPDIRAVPRLAEEFGRYAVAVGAAFGVQRPSLLTDAIGGRTRSR